MRPILLIQTIIVLAVMALISGCVRSLNTPPTSPAPLGLNTPTHTPTFTSTFTGTSTVLVPSPTYTNTSIPTPTSTYTSTTTIINTPTFTSTTTSTFTITTTACATRNVWGETSTGGAAISLVGTICQKYVSLQPFQLNTLSIDLAYSNSSASLGIYSDNGNYPGNLLYDFAPSAMSVGLNQRFLLNASFYPAGILLPAGTYWLAFASTTSSIVTGASGSTADTVMAWGQLMPNAFPTGQSVNISGQGYIWAHINTCQPGSTPLATYTPVPVGSITATPISTVNATSTYTPTFTSTSAPPTPAATATYTFTPTYTSTTVSCLTSPVTCTTISGKIAAAGYPVGIPGVESVTCTSLNGSIGGVYTNTVDSVTDIYDDYTVSHNMGQTICAILDSFDDGTAANQFTLSYYHCLGTSRSGAAATWCGGGVRGRTSAPQAFDSNVTVRVTASQGSGSYRLIILGQ